MNLKCHLSGVTHPVLNVLRQGLQFAGYIVHKDAVSLLPLTLDVSERGEAVQPISPEASLPRLRSGNDLLGMGVVVELSYP